MPILEFGSVYILITAVENFDTVYASHDLIGELLMTILYV